MIDKKLERLSAEEAVKAGLIDALQKGEVKIEGIYSIGKDCKIDFKQKNFFFRDKTNEVRLVKFADNVEVLKFWERLGADDSDI